VVTGPAADSTWQVNTIVSWASAPLGNWAVCVRSTRTSRPSVADSSTTSAVAVRRPARQDDVMMSPPPGVIIADWRPCTGAGKAVSRAAPRLPPSAARSSSRTPVMSAGSMPGEVLCHQGTTTVSSLAQEGTPG
jgi:hypothetical protein